MIPTDILKEIVHWLIASVWMQFSLANKELHTQVLCAVTKIRLSMFGSEETIPIYTCDSQMPFIKSLRGLNHVDVSELNPGRQLEILNMFECKLKYLTMSTNALTIAFIDRWLRTPSRPILYLSRSRLGSDNLQIVHRLLQNAPKNSIYGLHLASAYKTPPASLMNDLYHFRLDIRKYDPVFTMPCLTTLRSLTISGYQDTTIIWPIEIKLANLVRLELIDVEKLIISTPKQGDSPCFPKLEIFESLSRDSDNLGNLYSHLKLAPLVCIKIFILSGDVKLFNTDKKDPNTYIKTLESVDIYLHLYIQSDVDAVCTFLQTPNLRRIKKVMIRSSQENYFSISRDFSSILNVHPQCDVIFNDLNHESYTKLQRPMTDHRC
jgi:hypothetical protein